MVLTGLAWFVPQQPVWRQARASKISKKALTTESLTTIQHRLKVLRQHASKQPCSPLPLEAPPLTLCHLYATTRN